jgi:hypothetical protein
VYRAMLRTLRDIMVLIRARPSLNSSLYSVVAEGTNLPRPARGGGGAAAGASGRTGDGERVSGHKRPPPDTKLHRVHRELLRGAQAAEVLTR